MELYADKQRIAGDIRLADSFFSRFRGLMLRRSLGPGEGLLLKDCRSIHCCFMLMDIDVIYLSEDMHIIRTETVKPWHLGSNPRGTRHVLELGRGRSDGLNPGDILTIV